MIFINWLKTFEFSYLTRFTSKGRLVPPPHPPRTTHTKYSDKGPVTYQRLNIKQHFLLPEKNQMTPIKYLNDLSHLYIIFSFRLLNFVFLFHLLRFINLLYTPRKKFFCFKKNFFASKKLVHCYTVKEKVLWFKEISWLFFFLWI